jgi:hypothetical protein
MLSPRRLTALCLVIAAAGVASCSPSPRAPGGSSHAANGAVATIAPPAISDEKPRELPGIRNAVTFHEGFISGGAPEGDAGFETLAAMGVRTIISVDGAEPEVARAAAAGGMRYIHLPIGYNGMGEQRKLELVRATRDAIRNGAVYIHCHHGKHRSAGAAATISASLGWLTPAEGVERMKVSGTAPAYTGLYACARDATILDAGTIDAVPASFPSISRPSGLVKGMVEMDEVFEHLRAVEGAGWAVPAEHPDLVPLAEAGRLADLHRMLAESAYAGRKPAEFRGMMLEAHARAQRLEDMIAAGERRAALSAQFGLVASSCTECHARYRD